MLRFPVKKIRKQFKLLLLLVLLTSAVWFTYLHINQGKTIKLHFNYGKGRKILSCHSVSLSTNTPQTFKRAFNSPFMITVEIPEEIIP